MNDLCLSLLLDSFPESWATVCPRPLWTRWQDVLRWVIWLISFLFFSCWAKQQIFKAFFSFVCFTGLRSITFYCPGILYSMMYHLQIFCILLVPFIVNAHVFLNCGNTNLLYQQFLSTLFEPTRPKLYILLSQYWGRGTWWAPTSYIRQHISTSKLKKKKKKLSCLNFAWISPKFCLN